jgi:hypothetical protein
MQRTCLGCQQTDDHPRHVIALQDGSEVGWHMDCHATTGCESCRAQNEGAEQLTGDAFRAHVVSLGDDFHASLADQLNGA